MLKHKYTDQICIGVMLFAVCITVLFMNGESLGLIRASSVPGYQTRLFDRSRVHTVDILLEDWNGFLETAAGENYTACTLVIDGERFSGAGLRVKGNNSRRLTEKYGHKRYSLKVEFDHIMGAR